ncbi:MAG: FAD:protein FMN transferase [Treponema sp.]|nr:FAD:protein FMN transferase [Treponema sp.]
MNIKKILCPLLLFSPALFFVSCAKVPPARSEFILGTVCTVNLYEKGTKKLYAGVFSRIRDIDRAMSANPPAFSPEASGAAGSGESDVRRINANAGIKPVKVSEDLIGVLERALYYAGLSNGAFDPTVGPLVKLWGIGTEEARIPGEGEIQAALDLVNWRDVLIDREEGTVFLRKPGMALDLGAIAKGYAADEAAALAEKNGVRRAIIDLGGNIFALGSREQDAPWRIGLQDPAGERGTYLGILPVRNKSVVTSGVYERFFEAEDRRYHHILSTQNGRPVDNGLLAVTIIADRSIDADALSTAVFSLGWEKGRLLVEAVPGAEAVFVFTGGSIRGTGEAMEIFTLTGGKYRIEK